MISVLLGGLVAMTSASCGPMAAATDFGPA